MWERIPAVHQEVLREVKYEKAQGEGIAKVCTHMLDVPNPLHNAVLFSAMSTLMNSLSMPLAIKHAGPITMGSSPCAARADHHKQAGKAERLHSPDDSGDDALF